MIAPMLHRSTMMTLGSGGPHYDPKSLSAPKSNHEEAQKHETMAIFT